MNSVWFIQDSDDSDRNMDIFKCNPSVIAKSLFRPSAPLINFQIEMSSCLVSYADIKNSSAFDIRNYAYLPPSDIPIQV
jgi:hypothetical protein